MKYKQSTREQKKIPTARMYVCAVCVLYSTDNQDTELR
jgi:hypothetical protein